MSSRILAGLLVAGCVTAASGGAYIAVRQNAAEPTAAAAAPPLPGQGEPAAKPVSETEAVVSGAPAPAVQPQPVAPAPSPAPVATPVRETPRPAPAPVATPVRETPRPAAAPTPRRQVPAAPSAPRERHTAVAAAPAPAQPVVTERAGTAATPPPVQVERIQEPATPRVPDRPADSRVDTSPPAPVEPQFEEVVLPTASVIGLQVDTPLSSERSRLEDRVDARVARDVMAGGRLAIPAGSRVIGSVTAVERGGKVKERARLGVRFHTLLLSDGREVPLRTEPIYREGESPAGESARKIGGAAVGGAILGAIMGGGKGAVIGGATGAAGGSAAVMAGDRNAATLPHGTIVTVRLSAPAALEVEKRDEQR